MDRAGGRTRRVRMIEDPAAKLSTYPGTLRQLAVAGLGHDEPTILITNQHSMPAKQVIETYSRRMNIEQRLAEAIRSFHLDSLTGAVPLNIDLDVVLTVLAHTLCAALRRRIPATKPPPPTPCNAGSCPPAGTSSGHGNQFVVRLDRRTYSPVLRQATLPEISVPWLGGRTVRYEFA
ncbi:hypothetical protein FXW78_38260 [Rhodococcus opacus]|nr:hypothetical protein [Rhodococcus opacus]